RDPVPGEELEDVPPASLSHLRRRRGILEDPCDRPAQFRGFTRRDEEAGLLVDDAFLGAADPGGDGRRLAGRRLQAEGRVPYVFRIMNFARLSAPSRG